MTTSQNEYDKAVEVDQRKLRDPDLTPVVIRKWKTTYDIYANDPARRMTMAQAFGDVSLLCLGMVFPDDTVSMDNAGFNEYLTSKFLKTAHLFNDIKTAASKVRIYQGTHITVDSLHTYHSNFCKSFVHFSEEIVLQNTSTDLHFTWRASRCVLRAC